MAHFWMEHTIGMSIYHVHKYGMGFMFVNKEVIFSLSNKVQCILL
jgi:hypothetical protein